MINLSCLKSWPIFIGYGKRIEGATPSRPFCSIFNFIDHTITKTISPPINLNCGQALSVRAPFGVSYTIRRQERFYSAVESAVRPHFRIERRISHVISAIYTSYALYGQTIWPSIQNLHISGGRRCDTARQTCRSEISECSENCLLVMIFLAFLLVMRLFILPFSLQKSS